MRRFSCYALAALLLSGIVGCGSSGPGVGARSEEEFRQRVNPGKKITVLPPVIQYFRRTNLGDEPMPEFNQLVHENLMSGMNEAFTQMKYSVLPCNFDDETLLVDQELALDLTNVRNDFNRALMELSNSRKSASIWFSPLVNVFSERAQADLILMAQGYGFETSGGKKTKDTIMAGIGAVLGYLPSVQFTGTQIVMLLLDGVTGELLWLNYNGQNTSFNAKDSSAMAKLAYALLNPLE